jgi:ParB family chromosome partitioning protein
MSAKADNLLSKFGANIAGTVSQRGGSTAVSAPEASTDRFAGATRSRSVGELPVDAIVADEQVRTEFDDDDLARLGASIKRFGQLAPIRVRFDEGRGAWVVLVGERRWRACRLAGLPKVRVEFVEREMTEADIVAEQAVENLVRADLRPVEQGRAFRRLMELNGWSATELSEAISVEPSAISRALALLKLPAEVAALVDAGEVKATAGYELTKLDSAEDQRQVAAEIAAGQLDHKATVAEVARRRTSSKAASNGRGAKAKPTVRTIRVGPAKVTVAFRKAVDEAEVVAALKAAIEVVEKGRGAEAA